MDSNTLHNDDLVFSIYIVDTAKGKTPAVIQHKDTNLLELEIILTVLQQSVDAAKQNYVIQKPPEQQPPQPEQPPQPMKNPNNQPEEIGIYHPEYQETGTPDD